MSLTRDLSKLPDLPLGERDLLGLVSGDLLLSPRPLLPDLPPEAGDLDILPDIRSSNGLRGDLPLPPAAKSSAGLRLRLAPPDLDLLLDAYPDILT